MIPFNFLRHAVLLCALVFLTACGERGEAELLAAAQGALKKGDHKSATVEVKAALQANPASPQARALLGQVLLAQGEPKLAAVELEKAIELHAPDAQVVPLYVRALLGQGLFKKVVDEYAAKRIGDDAANAALRASVASAYLSLGNLPQADLQAEEALKLSPKYVPALLVKARVLATRREYKVALTLVESAIGMDGSQDEAWKLKGDLLLVDPLRSAEAIAAFRQAYSIRPEYIDAHVSAVSYFVQRRDFPSAKSELTGLRNYPKAKSTADFLEAQLALAEGNYLRAGELIQLPLQAAPDDARLLQVAGAVALQTGELTKAEKHLVRALNQQPELSHARLLLARTYLRLGQPSRAIAVLQPALDGSAPGVDLLVLAAEAQMHNGDAAQAETLFKRAAAVAPGDVRVRIALALSDLSKGRSDAAVAQLEKIAMEDAGGSADLSLIAALMRRNDLVAAVRAIEALKKKQPGQPLAPILRARVEMLRNDESAARSNYETALKIKADFFPAVSGLAALDIKGGRLAEAAKRFEDLLKQNPQSSDAYLALADLRARLGASKSDVLNLLLAAVKAAPLDQAPRVALINQYLRNYDFRAALTASQDAVSKLPESPELLDVLARAFLASGDINQAVTTYGKLSKLEPKSAMPYVKMAEAYASKRDIDGATRSFRRALEVVPGHVEAQRGLIRVALQQGKVDLAISAARELQRRGPDDPAGYLFEGDIYAETKKWDPAISAYRVGLTKLRTSNQLAIRLHAVLGAAGRAAEALSFETKWLKDFPRDAAFRFYLGDVYMARRDFTEAERKYLDVLNLQPSNGLAHNNLAWLLAKMGKPGAVDHAVRAIAIMGESPALLDTLATAEEAGGDMAKAVRASERAVQLAPELPDLRLNLARLYIKAKKKDLAIAELDRLQALGSKIARQKEVGELMAFAKQM